MKWILYSVAFLIASSFSSEGCRSRNPVGQVADKVREAPFLLGKLRENGLKKTTALDAHARVHAEGYGESVSANANIIWLKDSAVWMNIKKFGIEGARALITPDSFTLLNRVDNVYSQRSLEWLQSRYQLPDGFPLIEAFLLGKAWMAPDIELSSAIKEGSHQLYGNNGNLWVDYRIEEGSFLLKQLVLLERNENRSVKITYGNYKKTNGLGRFPFDRKIEAYSPDAGLISLEIELSDIHYNTPKSFKFQIPEHYERIE